MLLGVSFALEGSSDRLTVIAFSSKSILKRSIVS